jgi:tetratricopeptide (TPR) repeat protein
VGPLNPATRQTADNLIYLYARQEKYPQAESLTRKILNIVGRFKNLNPLETANYQNSLGTFCHLQGKFAQAESFFQSALALREKALGPDHPNVAKTLDNLAEARKSRKEYQGLDTLYERIVKILEKNSGTESHVVADKMDAVAQFYESIGQPQAAKKWALRAERARSKAKPDGNQ